MSNNVKLVISPFLALVLREKMDYTGGAVHGPSRFYVVRDGGTGREYVYDVVDCTAVEMPACCWAEHDASPGERLYAAFWRSGHHSMWGRAEGSQIPAPSWAELKALAAKNDPRADREVLRWEELARWALDFLPPYAREARSEQEPPYLN